MSIEIIGGQWAAGETKTFHVQGEYLEVLDAQYPIDVYVMDAAGASVSSMRNAEASFFMKPGLYKTVQIKSTLSQTIRVFIGSGDAGTRRISSVVQVVDGGRSRSLNGTAFAKAGGQGAVAAEYSRASLWNPAGSPVRVLLKQFSVSSSGLASCNVGMLSATDGALKSAPSAKYLGGPASANVQAYGGSNPAVIGGALLDFVIFGAAGTLNRVLAEPYIIPPGKGIYFELATLNTQLSYTAEFTEELIDV